MCAGLTISDKPALMGEKEQGAEWVARDGDDGVVWSYADKPTRPDGCRVWCGDAPIKKNIKIACRADEPVNIDLALAQIAEMESAEVKPMSEYIKREDAIKAVDGAVSSEHVCDNINAIPAADVEPVVRGEWDKTKDKEHDFRTYYCSVCGKGEYYFNATQYAYCPHCGARMQNGAHMERSGSGE